MPPAGCLFHVSSSSHLQQPVDFGAAFTAVPADAGDWHTAVRTEDGDGQAFGESGCVLFLVYAVFFFLMVLPDPAFECCHLSFQSLFPVRQPHMT